MEHVKKSLRLAMMVLLLDSGFAYADEQQGVDQAVVGQSEEVCADCDCHEDHHSIVGAWVVNAITHFRANPLRAEGESEGDLVAPEEEQVAPEALQPENHKIKVRSFGNVLYEEDGGFVSDFLLGLQNGMPGLFTLDTTKTIGTGAWQKIGHRTFKSVTVHEQIVNDVIKGLPEWEPGTRVRTETVVKVSKDGQRFEGKMTSTFFRLHDLHFDKPICVPPVKWQVSGARIPFKLVQQ